MRRWEAWHRFATLCLLAHAYLAVLRLRARAAAAAREGAADEPDLLPLTVPEVRRLVLALAGGAEQRTFRLAWARPEVTTDHPADPAPRGARRRPDRRRVGADPAAAPAAATTDGAAAARPPPGAQRHRLGHPPARLLARGAEGMRQVGEVYKRYQLWRAEGRWQRIAAALGLEDREVAL